MSDTPQPGPFSVSERLRAAQTIAGTSRHYQGPGLGTPPGWTCPSCERQWTSEPADGCPVCIAEARVALAHETERKKAEEILNQPLLTTTTVTGQQTRTETSGRAVSPLLAGHLTSTDMLAEKVADKVMERLAALVPQAAAPEGSILPPPPGLYAILVGLQLVAQAQADGAEDPLLPPIEAVHQLIREVEALPTLQSYLIDPTSAPPAAPIPEEPEA